MEFFNNSIKMSNTIWSDSAFQDLISFFTVIDFHRKKKSKYFK
ncbi:hypothetical protein LEP1GSC034_2174 [Leptospira interrogans str. 2003000735]|uniref:Uncharacterized protein n=2 Tax=Leptospira interrogans TaxID=173 RepID=A0A0F6IHQ9_LEPIR|nr:hypothetical protein G436_1711 [Leptospira interrogans serovar Hardjo str. Norma]EKN90191.1 hypothetical protein LEP1GSC027_1716 [Leptospira interrogans str. 2002000624]EKO08680.1 hypothetical protein LEP1GSC077_3092 [Leptospira interrogans str. C10069]EKR81217.1 hypothetical protein LEP1GSC099_0780 [Leptospira interrogans str. UI 08452]EMJ37584.1 hypothetical protein LEP1GSC079_0509 [Leptospira interrogans str. FPW1039]EMJ68227.1 hypothetical protein LEP1GSC034_2174 [Leptospira interrogans